jgi:hypothetical protein
MDSCLIHYTIRALLMMRKATAAAMMDHFDVLFFILIYKSQIRNCGRLDNDRQQIPRLCNLRLQKQFVLKALSLTDVFLVSYIKFTLMSSVAHEWTKNPPF